MRAVVALAAILFVGCVCAYTSEEYENTFVSWMKEHNRVYSSDMYRYRFETFKNNMDYVRDWNAKGSSTVLGLNGLADLSNSEYQNIYLGTRMDATDRLAKAESFTSSSTSTIPLADTIDWRTKGGVTPIKDQGQCGSCWSFSATGGIEGTAVVTKNPLVSVSEQQLVDCSASFGNQGCNGGLMDSAFKYVISVGGIVTEASYPYTPKAGTCLFKPTTPVATKISKYTDVKAGKEDDLLKALNIQPVSVAIDASHNSFQLYKSGVYVETACSSSRLDHGVLAVGYGTDDTSKADYWIVKNSWGVVWGEKGFIQMARNKNNQCGIATSASYPIV